MLTDLLQPTVPGLQLLDVTTTDQILFVEFAATASAAACPLCGQFATRVHSHYTRQPADLPWADCVVRYRLQVRRFFCDTLACPRRIFAERFGSALRAYARRTTLLATRLQHLGLAVGGALGAVLATLLGMPISPSTLLRLSRAVDLPSSPTPRVLSIDDFAFRKGQTYGTILVALERHWPGDLLPDREAATVVTWLQNHPGVEIISRDRANAYGQAATLGAPQAQQVADRFHLLCNLGEALQRLLERQPAVLRAVTEQLAQLAAALGISPDPEVEAAPPIAATGPGESLPSPPQQEHAAHRESDPRPEPDLGTPGRGSAPGAAPSAPTPVQARFATIKELAAQGCGQREIARRLQLNRRTVRRYLVADEPPARAVGHQAQPRAHRYLPYLRGRWAAGVATRSSCGRSCKGRATRGATVVFIGCWCGGWGNPVGRARGLVPEPDGAPGAGRLRKSAPLRRGAPVGCWRADPAN
jgi:DNA-binding CsgD family transcriptional regulator